ncbi:MAG TPA: trigger factor [Gammaproteobacteria bacterium]|jgi:trigger factor|nr:trigger factor [Gammaproteobacteria bacterium]
MQVSVEKVSTIERKLTIVVPANTVEEELSKQVTQFAQKANIKGFRPGKAPVSYIKQHYGEDMRREAMGKVIQNALYNALVEQKLTPVSTPEVEPKMMLADQPLEFVASFEIMPEITSIEFKMDKIEKPVTDVTDEDLNRVIDQLRKQYTKWNVIDRAAALKDRVVLEYYAIYEGNADTENKIQNFPLELGSNVMLPGFEEGLVGSKAGDEKKLNLTFPADFGDKERAGKPIEFVVTIKQVFEADMPEIDAEFVKRLGIKSGEAEELMKQIRQSLEQERDRLVKEKLKEQVFKALLEQNQMDVPKALVSREAKNIHDEVYPQHQHHDHSHHSDEELSSFNDVAKKRVTLGLLIAEYAKMNEIKPDAARVDARIKEIAAAYENPKEVIDWLSSQERRGGIEAQVMEDQVLDKLMNGVTVSDKTMSYAELKGIRI